MLHKNFESILKALQQKTVQNNVTKYERYYSIQRDTLYVLPTKTGVIVKKTSLNNVA